MTKGFRGVIIIMSDIIEKWFNDTIRPASRVDGGDLRFESFNGQTLVIGAYAACATCLCCEKRIQDWLSMEMKELYPNQLFNIKINRYVPYYKS